jgi:hypothetical protein
VGVIKSAFWVGGDWTSDEEANELKKLIREVTKLSEEGTGSREPTVGEAVDDRVTVETRGVEAGSEPGSVWEDTKDEEEEDEDEDEEERLPEALSGL